MYFLIFIAKSLIFKSHWLTALNPNVFEILLSETDSSNICIFYNNKNKMEVEIFVWCVLVLLPSKWPISINLFKWKCLYFFYLWITNWLFVFSSVFHTARSILTNPLKSALIDSQESSKYEQLMCSVLSFFFYFAGVFCLYGLVSFSFLFV